MSSISEFSTELRALFTKILDIETGDGACALSLLNELEDTYTNYPVTITPTTSNDETESSQEIVEVEVTDLANHVADMNDMMLELILDLNKRIKILESKCNQS